MSSCRPHLSQNVFWSSICTKLSHSVSCGKLRTTYFALCIFILPKTLKMFWDTGHMFLFGSFSEKWQYKGLNKNSLNYEEINNLTWTVTTAAPWHFLPPLPLHSKCRVVCSSRLTYCLGIVSNSSPSKATCWDSRRAAVLKSNPMWENKVKEGYIKSDQRVGAGR